MGTAVSAQKEFQHLIMAIWAEKPGLTYNNAKSKI
jgi:hypothetical protein